MRPPTHKPVVIGAIAALLALGTIGASSAKAARRDCEAGGPTATLGRDLGTTGAFLHQPASGTHIDLTPYGYDEHEFLVSGTANAAGLPPQKYTSRIIVRQPVDPSQFNRRVVVEWFNVSFPVDADIEWVEMSEHLMREGTAYVAVSAQPSTNPLQSQDPVRYAEIKHPGTQYADDIYTQVGRLLRTKCGPIRGAAKPKIVIATGISQSANRLTTYLTNTQPTAKVFDAFLIDRGLLPTNVQATVPTIFTLGEWEARDGQEQHGSNVRVWHMAGSAHTDVRYVSWMNLHAIRDSGGQTPPFDWEALGDWGQSPALNSQCGYGPFGPFVAVPGGSYFPGRYLIRAALVQVERWAKTGKPPVQPSLFQFPIQRDGDGNIVGGLRLPQMDVPVAGYDGNCPAPNVSGGSTISFPDVELQRRYPTFADYSDKMTAAARVLVKQRFLLACDAVDMYERVQKAASRWPADRRGTPRASPFECEVND